MIAHDAQCVAAGVTTILDALCLGDLGFDTERGQTFLDGVRDLDELADKGALKGEHFLHLRCELPARDMPPALDPVADHPRVVMVSLMDHSPGVGQYRDLTRYAVMRKRQTQWNDAQVQARIDGLPGCWIAFAIATCLWHRMMMIRLPKLRATWLMASRFQNFP